jgi:hypothetical protein
LQRMRARPCNTFATPQSWSYCQPADMAQRNMASKERVAFTLSLVGLQIFIQRPQERQHILQRHRISYQPYQPPATYSIWLTSTPMQPGCYPLGACCPITPAKQGHLDFCITTSLAEASLLPQGKPRARHNRHMISMISIISESRPHLPI